MQPLGPAEDATRLIPVARVVASGSDEQPEDSMSLATGGQPRQTGSVQQQPLAPQQQRPSPRPHQQHAAGILPVEGARAQASPRRRRVAGEAARSKRSLTAAHGTPPLEEQRRSTTPPPSPKRRQRELATGGPASYHAAPHPEVGAAHVAGAVGNDASTPGTGAGRVTGGQQGQHSTRPPSSVPAGERRASGRGGDRQLGKRKRVDTADEEGDTPDGGWQDARGVNAGGAGTASPECGGAAISARGHTSGGRGKRKSTLLEAGTLILDTSWYTEDYIYTAGFRTETLYKGKVYTCEIVGKGGKYWPKPTFVVTAEDRPDKPLVAKSCTGCWTTVIKRINEGCERPPKTSVSGPAYFGLQQPDICAAIEALDPEKQCKTYWDGKVQQVPASDGGGVGTDQEAALDAEPGEDDRDQPPQGLQLPAEDGGQDGGAHGGGLDTGNTLESPAATAHDIRVGDTCSQVLTEDDVAYKRMQVPTAMHGVFRELMQGQEGPAEGERERRELLYVRQEGPAEGVTRGRRREREWRVTASFLPAENALWLNGMGELLADLDAQPGHMISFQRSERGGATTFYVRICAGETTLRGAAAAPTAAAQEVAQVAAEEGSAAVGAVVAAAGGPASFPLAAESASTGAPAVRVGPWAGGTMAPHVAIGTELAEAPLPPPQRQESTGRQRQAGTGGQLQQPARAHDLLATQRQSQRRLTATATYSRGGDDSSSSSSGGDSKSRGSGDGTGRSQAIGLSPAVNVAPTPDVAAAAVVAPPPSSAAAHTSAAAPVVAALPSSAVTAVVAAPPSSTAAPVAVVTAPPSSDLTVTAYMNGLDDLLQSIHRGDESVLSSIPEEVVLLVRSKPQPISALQLFSSGGGAATHLLKPIQASGLEAAARWLYDCVTAQEQQEQFSPQQRVFAIASCIARSQRRDIAQALHNTLVRNNSDIQPDSALQHVVMAMHIAVADVDRSLLGLTAASIYQQNAMANADVLVSTPSFKDTVDGISNALHVAARQHASALNNPQHVSLLQLQKELSELLPKQSPKDLRDVTVSVLESIMDGMHLPVMEGIPDLSLLQRDDVEVLSAELVKTHTSTVMATAVLDIAAVAKCMASSSGSGRQADEGSARFEQMLREIILNLAPHTDRAPHTDHLLPAKLNSLAALIALADPATATTLLEDNTAVTKAVYMRMLLECKLQPDADLIALISNSSTDMANVLVGLTAVWRSYRYPGLASAQVTQTVQQCISAMTTCAARNGNPLRILWHLLSVLPHDACPHFWQLAAEQGLAHNKMLQVLLLNQSWIVFPALARCAVNTANTHALRAIMHAAGRVAFADMAIELLVSVLGSAAAAPERRSFEVVQVLANTLLHVSVADARRVVTSAVLAVDKVYKSDIIDAIFRCNTSIAPVFVQATHDVLGDCADRGSHDVIGLLCVAAQYSADKTTIQEYVRRIFTAIASECRTNMRTTAPWDALLYFLEVLMDVDLCGEIRVETNRQWISPLVDMATALYSRSTDAQLKFVVEGALERILTAARHAGIFSEVWCHEIRASVAHNAPGRVSVLFSQVPDNAIVNTASVREPLVAVLRAVVRDGRHDCTAALLNGLHRLGVRCTLSSDNDAEFGIASVFLDAVLKDHRSNTDAVLKDHRSVVALLLRGGDDTGGSAGGTAGDAAGVGAVGTPPPEMVGVALHSAATNATADEQRRREMIDRVLQTKMPDCSESIAWETAAVRVAMLMALEDTEATQAIQMLVLVTRTDEQRLELLRDVLITEVEHTRVTHLRLLLGLLATELGCDVKSIRTDSRGRAIYADVVSKYAERVRSDVPPNVQEKLEDFIETFRSEVRRHPGQ